MLSGPKQSWRPKGLLVMWSFYTKLVKNEVCFLLGKRPALCSAMCGSHGEPGTSPGSWARRARAVTIPPGTAPTLCAVWFLSLTRLDT